MLISIIIPVYNSEDSIRNCLNSILNQTIPNFEVVVINDGSTDNTLAILEEYAKKYSNIKVYSFENAGVSVARQRGINLASGEYFIFVDSDDTIESELLFNISLTIDSFPNVDLIRYQSYLVHDAPNKNNERYNFLDSVNVSMSGIEALKLWSRSGKKYAVYWLFAFHRDLFSYISFPKSLRCYEDVALIPILIAKANKVVTIDYVGYNYVYNNSFSLTHTKDEATERSRAKDFFLACKYAINHFKELPFVTKEDIIFLETDYRRRLDGKYNSLSDNLKEEFANLYYN